MAGTNHALDRFADAHESGYRIIAGKYNEVLSSGLSIDAPPALRTNGQSISLNSCRSVLMDSLRRAGVPLPDFDQQPWSLGFVNDKKNSELFIEYGDAEDALKVALEVLKRRKWTKEQWKSFIVLPIERHYQRWRKWLSESNRERRFTDTRKKSFPPRMPRSENARDLLAELLKQRPKGKADAVIARTKFPRLSEKEIQNLLTAVQRYEKKFAEYNANS